MIKSVFAGGMPALIVAALLLVGAAGIPQSLHYSSKSGFAPRIGFAWRPFGDDKTVILGG